MAATMIGGWNDLRFRLNHDRLGFIVQRSFAAAAQMVVRPELDEVAMVTPNYFPRVDWCQCSGHFLYYGVARARYSAGLFAHLDISQAEESNLITSG
jgi:hypothetical protein